MARMTYPKHPNIFQKIGHVSDIMAQPCQPTPMIWVEAYFSSLPTLIWSLFKPDPFDLSGGKGGRPHKRTRKFVLNCFGYERAIAVAGGSLLKWACFAGEWSNMIGWYFLVADASVDLAVNWSSTAMRWSGCKIPGEPWGTINYHDVVPVENGVWARLKLGDADYGTTGITAAPASINIAMGVSAAISAYATPGPSPDFPDLYRSTGVAVEVRLAGSGLVIAHQDAQHDGYGGNTTSVFKKDWTLPGSAGEYQLWVRPEGPTQYGYLKNAYLGAYGQRINQGLEPDP